MDLESMLMGFVMAQGPWIGWAIAYQRELRRRRNIKERAK
jgi:hypothetical protein